MCRWRLAALVGLGLTAGAVLHAPLSAQRDTTKKRDTTIVVAPRQQPPDSALRDSLARVDSIHQAKIRADTIKSPLAHAERPPELTIGHRLYWTRDSLFATGSITLADLLERVTGVTLLRGGWISAPQVAAYEGDIRRVRVFYDGIEWLPLDPRGRGVLDLTQVSLWSVESASIERTADEIRVYLQSWRVRGTVPETRTDISTGDQATNMYRGFFGQRFHNGAAVQFGAQQYGTTPPSLLGASSDQTSIIARAGWANAMWSIDGYTTRISRHRGVIQELTLDFIPQDTLPTLGSTRSDSYLRVAYGDPDLSPIWAQVMGVASKYDYGGVRVLSNRPTHLDSVSLDTNVFRSQYIAAVGTVRGPLRLSATGRVFGGGGQTIISPEVRGSFLFGPIGISAYAEGQGIDSASHVDVTAQLTPLSFVSLLASAGQIQGHYSILAFPPLIPSFPPATLVRTAFIDSSFSAKYLRAEVGLRIVNLWLVGGVMRRDSVRLAPPHMFDTTFTPVADRASTGITGAIRGQIWGPLRADVWGVRWNDSTGFYRPQYQTRTELFIRTNLLQRFPTNDFGLVAGIVHEYRSNVRFPVLTPVSSATLITTVPGYRTISTLLEIRVLSATISWQFRNILGERYMQVPFFIMPRQTNFYGVRWTFFN